MQGVCGIVVAAVVVLALATYCLCLLTPVILLLVDVFVAQCAVTVANHLSSNSENLAFK